ncbi:leucine-rich repeat protein [Capnocytophaga leadbetteri]|uniref:leucine-rich repeat protein n=1 Tax=Capnocytophaga leadbetteri TaxID=327575 RepID=UPI0028E79F3E|nr:leucine-rich repeat protein [Capnocytophaga leadbetteri]
MKTATLILTTAVVAATLFSCGKKDDGGDQAPIVLSESAITITKGEEKIVKAAAATGIKSAIPSHNKVQTMLQSNKPVQITIKGKEEGSDDIIVTDHRGNSATIKVTVKAKTVKTPKGFEVKSDIIFLKKNVETDVTDWVKKGSGNYTVSTPNTSVVREAGKKNGRLYAIGLSEGSNSEIVFKDIDKNEEVRVPVYVIAPFTAVGVPASMTANDVQTLNLTGVYSTTAVDGRHDRVTITANNGKAEATLVTRDVRNNVGQVVAKITTGIKITAKEAGEAIIQLTNGDGQSLKIKFTVTAYVANNYFNVDADGVLTIKPGVRLPAEVVLPSNAKKVAEKAFKNQPNVTTIDFNNVTEIEGSLFDNMANPTGINITKVIMRKVEKVGYDTFRNAVKLEVVDFPATLKFLGKEAFKGCNKLRAVAFRSATPPKGITYTGSEIPGGKADSAFDADGGNKVRLFIPIGSAAAYKASLNTDSKFKYRKDIQKGDWYTGDDHQSIVDIANFDKSNLDFSMIRR